MTSNTSTALKTNTFTRTGYTFDGWNTNANGTGTSYTNGQNVSLNSDTTLYAQWRATAELDPTPVVTPTPPVTPETTTPSTPAATTGAVAPVTTTPVPTYAVPTPATLAATSDPTSLASVVTAAIAGFGVTFAGIRSKKHSKR
jgi:uncharacterized repeat protein (TIGR02543 family)